MSMQTASEQAPGRAGLTKMTKVEVVVPGAELASVRALVTAAGATGFTSVAGVSGLGHSGFHQGGLLFNEQDQLSLLITVVPDERADALLAGLRALLEASSGVMFASDTYVSRPEHFR
jgi:nitrogen regulatory protein PII